MTRPIPSNLPFVFVVAVALSGFSVRQSLAGGETCVMCVCTRICLEWRQLKGSGIFIGETKISDPFDFFISMQRATSSPPGGLRAESTGHHVRRLNSDL